MFSAFVRVKSHDFRKKNKKQQQIQICRNSFAETDLWGRKLITFMIKVTFQEISLLR